MMVLYETSWRSRTRRVIPEGVWIVISLISMIAVTPTGASGAQPRHASRKLEGDQIELARRTSQQLFRVRREERARAEASPANRLGSEIVGLAEMLGGEVRASVAKGPAPRRLGSDGSTHGVRSPADGGEREPAPHDDPGREVRAAKRGLRRAALRERLNVLHVRLESLDSESLRQLPPRQRVVAERALHKARRIENEISQALAQPEEESDRRLRLIGKRLRPNLRDRASSTPDFDADTPTFRSLTRHRHSNSRTSEPMDRLEEGKTIPLEAKGEGGV